MESIGSAVPLPKEIKKLMLKPNTAIKAKQTPRIKRKREEKYTAANILFSLAYKAGRRKRQKKKEITGKESTKPAIKETFIFTTQTSVKVV